MVKNKNEISQRERWGKGTVWGEEQHDGRKHLQEEMPRNADKSQKN